MFARCLMWCVAVMVALAGSFKSLAAQRDCVSGCIGPSPVRVTFYSGQDTIWTGNTGQITFTVTNIGTTIDTYYFTMSCSNATCISESLTSYSVSPSTPIQVTVTFQGGAANTTAIVGLTAADSAASCPGGGNAPLTGGLISCYQSSASHLVANVAGPAPIVSLAPYSSGRSLAADGAEYAHSTPAVGSMATLRSATLVYNSSTTAPASLLTVDVSNPANANRYPTTYQLQIQLASNGTYLQLMNGSTSVYYTAATTTRSRLVAAIDARANGLATGAFPVNVVVTSNYTEGPRSSTVASRLLVNDQTGSSFGAGVQLAGVPRLYPVPGTYSWLLTGGDGGMAYFDRACSTCPFVSPAGENDSLGVYTDPQLGQLYRLSGMDGSIVDFRNDGRVLRHFALASIQDLTFTWSDTLLTSITDATSRGFSFAYSAGKLTQITDFTGRVTSVSIVSGQLVRIIDPDGLRDSLSYAANSVLTQVNDRAGGIWNYLYNSVNQEASVTGPSAIDYTGVPARPTTSIVTAGVIAWQPNTPGTSAAAPKANVRPDTVRATVTDPLGNVTKVVQDRFGLAVKVINPLGEVDTTARDTLGNATRIQHADGHVITRGYIGYRLMNSTDNTTGQFVTFTYDASGRLQTVGGNSTRLDYYYHDGTQGPVGTLKQIYLGNTGTYAQPSGGVAFAQHFPNAYGQDTLVVDGAGHRSRSVWTGTGAGGNLAQTVDAKGHVTSFHYNAYGLPDTTTLVTGGKQTVTSDVMDRASAVTDPLGRTTQFTYSPLGITRIVDPKGQVYKFDLNPWGLVVARHDLGDTTKVDSMKYDVGGNLRTMKTRRGDTVNRTYDARGRVLTISGPDFPSATFTYGLNGAWLVAANTNGRDSVAFDLAGRPVFASQLMPDGVTAFQMSYGYDSNGRLVSRSAPSGGSSQRWVYDQNLGLLDTLCELGTCASFSRDVEGKPNVITYNAGQSGAWSLFQGFDSLHMVTLDTFSMSQLNTDFEHTWWYDSLGHLTSDGYFSQQYAYDSAGQLRNVCTYDFLLNCYNEYGGQGLGAVAYTYDAAGNRTDAGAGAVVGAGNRVTLFKNYTVTYDQNGNVLQKAGLGPSNRDTTAMQWNALGQLTRVEKWPAGGLHTVDTLRYDALGHRVAKSVNGVSSWSLYDGDQVAMDVDAGTKSMVAEYGYFANSDLYGMRTPTWTGIAINDPMIHTLLGLAASSGGTEIKRYDVLGNPWSQATTDTGTLVRFRMGGQEFDQEIGLYHLGARYYDPVLGRFISEDPAGVDGGLNLYKYAGNDPVNRRDPTGLDECYEVDHHIVYDEITGIILYEYDVIFPVDPIYCGGGGGRGGGAGGGGNGESNTQPQGRQPAPIMCSTMQAWPAIPSDGVDRVTSQFGPRPDPRQGHQGQIENHPGIDIHAPSGSAAVAAYGGVVTSVQPVTTDGGHVTVRTPAGFSYGFWDLGPDLTVHVGQQVEAGDILGYSAPNADETGTHIHFEIRSSNGTPVNPAMCMDQSG